VPAVTLVPDPAAVPPQTARVANIANGLTLLRLLLVPVFAVLLLHDGGQDTGWRTAAAVVFAVASVTDRLDGELARRYGLVTEFGKLADPIADKALIGTALVGLSALALLPWWVTAVILVREIGVTVLRFWVIRHGVIPASRGGKAKTLAQALAIELYLLPLPHGVLAPAVMFVALVLTLLTGADYVLRATRLRRATRPAHGVAPLAPVGTAAPGVVEAPGGVAPAAIHAALEAQGATVAVAESLTAGLLAAALTENPGASRTFRGGIVVHATDLKASLGGVPAGLLAELGPVSAPVAEAMAEGVRQRLAAGYGVALTGVAGPEPQGGQPVGTVYVGVAGPRGTVVRRLALAGDRARIRAAAVQGALDLLAVVLSGRSAIQDLEIVRNQ